MNISTLLFWRVSSCWHLKSVHDFWDIDRKLEVGTYSLPCLFSPNVYIRAMYSHACPLVLVPTANIFKFCIRKYTVGFVKIYSNWNIIYSSIWKSAANMPINKCSSFCDPCECVNHVFVFDFGCCLIKNAWFSVLYRKSIALWSNYFTLIWLHPVSDIW